MGICRHFILIAAVHDRYIRPKPETRTRCIDCNVSRADHNHFLSDVKFLPECELFEKFVTTKNADEPFSRNIEFNIFLSTDGDKDCIGLFCQRFERQLSSDARVEDEFHSKLFEQLQFLVQTVFRKSVRRNSVLKNSARLCVTVVHGNSMSETNEIIRRCQSRRPGADNGDMFSGRREFFFDQALIDDPFFSHLIHDVRKVPVDFTLVHWFVNHFSSAAHLAVEITNSANGSRQGVVAQRQLECFFDPSFFQKLQISGNIHVKRAAVFAQSHKEVLTHTGFASLINNMPFVLIAEIPQRR